MNIVVIGAQWGDEGKGKIVDYLAEGAQQVVRFSGGANAGHTIVVGGKKYALHQVPSGILHADKTVFLGSGMVIDPVVLFDELKMLHDSGIAWEGRVFISDRAHLVLPHYRRMDTERDASRPHPIGTTGRGIGTAYSQKSERDGIRLADIDWDEKLADYDDETRAFVARYRDRLLPMRIDIATALWERRETNTLFEGAQGALLDLDSGTYPFVSSGISCAAGAAVGAGIGPRAIDRVYGVFKAYETRVGNGPMPSEFNDSTESALCDYVRTAGNEFGVTTGRPRRCGYLDVVALRYACRVNSIDSLVLTHLDIYDQMDSIEACVAYEIDGKTVTDFPASIPALTAARPVLERFPGWKTQLRSCHTYDELPSAAQRYIEFIERFTGTPVGIVSVGAERSETFVRTDPWQR
ncbi:MAG: adenylosuccinate synthase [Treponema sp.]|nr:adenylosuccinate synthase [Treponema sp.]